MGDGGRDPCGSRRLGASPTGGSGLLLDRPGLPVQTLPPLRVGTQAAPTWAVTQPPEPRVWRAQPGSWPRGRGEAVWLRGGLAPHSSHLGALSTELGCLTWGHVPQGRTRDVPGRPFPRGPWCQATRLQQHAGTPAKPAQFSETRLPHSGRGDPAPANPQHPTLTLTLRKTPAWSLRVSGVPEPRAEPASSTGPGDPVFPGLSGLQPN